MAGRSWGESWGVEGSFSWGDSWGFGSGAAAGAAWACTWGQTWGDSWGDTSFCDVSAPAAETPQGNYFDWWDSEWRRIRKERAERKKKKIPKKKRDVLDELDEIIVDLRARVQEAPLEPKQYLDYRKAEQFYQDARSAELSLKEMRAYQALALRILQEIDDEEAILLALH